MEILFRHKWKAILIPAMSLLIAVTVVLFFPRTYHSEAVLFLQIGHESVGMDPTATTGQTIALQQSGRDDEVKSAVDIMRSRGILTKTVDALGAEVVLGNTDRESSDEDATKLHAVAQLLQSAIGNVIGALKSIDPISEREEAIITLGKSLSIDTNRGSTAIGIDVEAETPELAQTILTALIQTYQEEHSRVHRNQKSQAFFQGQHDKLQEQLDNAKQAIYEAKNEMGLASIEGRRNALEKQAAAIEMATYEAEQQLAGATAQVAHLQQELSTMPDRIATSKTLLPNEGADLLRQELYSLEIRRADFTARFNDTHPLVVAVTSQVQKAQEVVDAQQKHRQETVDDVNVVHQDLSLNLKQQQSLAAGLESRLEKIESQSQVVLQDVQLLNQYEVRIDRLQREVNLRKSKFFKYAGNLEQARLNQELEEQRVSNVCISQEPLLIEKPVSPSKALVLLASLFLATAGTGAAILASERLHEKISDELPHDELLDLPVYRSLEKIGSREPVLAPK